MAGPVALAAASRPTAALVRRPSEKLPEGAWAAGGNIGGGALGQDEAVVFIPGGLRTRDCPCFFYFNACGCVLVSLWCVVLRMCEV